MLLHLLAEGKQLLNTRCIWLLGWLQLLIFGFLHTLKPHKTRQKQPFQEAVFVYNGTYMELVHQGFLYAALFLTLYFQIFLLLTYFGWSKKETYPGFTEADLPTVSIMIPCWNWITHRKNSSLLPLMMVVLITHGR